MGLPPYAWQKHANLLWMVRTHFRFQRTYTIMQEKEIYSHKSQSTNEVPRVKTSKQQNKTNSRSELHKIKGIR